MTCYNVVACETRATASLPPSILSPELALPVVATCFVTRSQAALHLLSCLDTLTQAQDQRFTVREDSEDRQAGCGKVYSREDFSAVTRFESKFSIYRFAIKPNFFRHVLILKVKINAHKQF